MGWRRRDPKGNHAERDGLPFISGRPPPARCVRSLALRTAILVTGKLREAALGMYAVSISVEPCSRGVVHARRHLGETAGRLVCDTTLFVGAIPAPLASKALEEMPPDHCDVARARIDLKRIHLTWEASAMPERGSDSACALEHRTWVLDVSRGDEKSVAVK